ncbi:MAG: hypothetical protein Q9205_007311 [Flavoplaca limonia]
MRLLNTKTLEFVEIVRPEEFKYAILSHTWGEEEVSFEDFRKSESKRLQGYKKIEAFCAQAQIDGFDHVWIDTCCIDKKSSAELSEAINSMYKWYSWAKICYVHFSDFSLATDDIMRRSRWFTRGWTLQELLASRQILFYDQHWHYIGNKIELAVTIACQSGIEESYTEGKKTVREASVAARMSWASKRQTSRPEDQAYCLMGLYKVNMPLLYGEGGFKAFQRLQHEIIKVSEDESLFAWYEHKVGARSGVFASSPWAFWRCGDIEPVMRSPIQRSPYSITSRGLSIDATYQPVPPSRLPTHFLRRAGADTKVTEFLLLPLKCARKDPQNSDPTSSRNVPRNISAILLMPITGDYDNVFVRIVPHETRLWERFSNPKENLQHRKIFIQQPSN